MRRIGIGIVIVTYNSGTLIDPLFASLAAHTTLADVDFAIVDNDSHDDTRARLAAWQSRIPTLRVLPQSRNTGFAEGCNLGITDLLARGCDRILLLNPDTEVTPNWLSPLVEALEANPKMAAVQPLLTLYDEPDRVNSSGNVVHFLGFGYCDGYRAPVTEFPTSGVGEVGYGTGACLLIRKEALDEVGLFDPFYFLYHEDFDLQIRMRQAGWSIGIAYASRVLHKYRPNMSKAKFRWLERNRLLALAKLWPAERLALFAPALLGLEVVMLAFAAKEHWLPEKLSIYGELLRNAPGIAASRAETQRRRLDPNPENERHYFRAEMQTEALSNGLLMRLSKPLLRAYMKVAGSALGSEDRG